MTRSRSAYKTRMIRCEGCEQTHTGQFRPEQKYCSHGCFLRNRPRGRSLKQGERSTQLCACGCGEHTYFARYRRKGVRRGDPLRHLPGHYKVDTPLWKETDTGFTSPCWIWQRSKDAQGYGKLFKGRRHWRAHRFYYTKAKGPIPHGREIDHQCGMKPCVNPEHLCAVTKGENRWLGWMRGAGLSNHQILDLRQWVEANLSPAQISALWSSYVEE